MKCIDLAGQRFGRLQVIERAPNNRNGRVMWYCLCDCGRDVVVRGEDLRYGCTKSCGCLDREVAREKMRKLVTVHNGCGTRLYAVWNSMKQRCYDPNAENYEHYGGRGITMCDEWHYSFAAFREWAMQTGYDEHAPYGACTIDRINVDGNYCPDNCRWATAKEQRANQRPRLRRKSHRQKPRPPPVLTRTYKNTRFTCFSSYSRL